MSQLRKCRIRQLLDKITTTDETDAIQPSSMTVINDVMKDIRQIDSETTTEDQIKHVDETIMDANIYNMACQVTYKCVQSVNYTQHSFSSEEFGVKLIRFLTADQQDDYTIEHLNQIRKHVTMEKIMPCLCSFSSIYGGLINRPAPPPKEKKQPVVKEANAPKPTKKQLIKVTELEKNDKKSDDILRFHMKVLTEEYKSSGAPVDYYEFVIDTQDFSVTVENIFYTSFNLNDGKIRLILDADIPKLLPLDKKQRQNLSQTESMKKDQVVTSITMDAWRAQSARIRQGILQKRRARATGKY